MVCLSNFQTNSSFSTESFRLSVEVHSFSPLWSQNGFSPKESLINPPDFYVQLLDKKGLQKVVTFPSQSTSVSLRETTRIRLKSLSVPRTLGEAVFVSNLQPLPSGHWGRSERPTRWRDRTLVLPQAEDSKGGRTGTNEKGGVTERGWGWSDDIPRGRERVKNGKVNRGREVAGLRRRSRRNLSTKRPSAHREWGFDTGFRTH